MRPATDRCGARDSQLLGVEFFGWEQPPKQIQEHQQTRQKSNDQEGTEFVHEKNPNTSLLVYQ